MEREDDAVEALRRQAGRLALLGRLARPVQHDLNNLLTVVFANLDMLKRRLPDEASQRQLGRVQEAARRVEGSTRAILSLARRPVPGEAIISPAAAVAAIEPLLSVLLPTPGALAVGLPDEAPACRFDQTLLDEALLGLARATADGQGTLRIAVADEAERAVLTVALPTAAADASRDAIGALRSLAERARGGFAEERGEQATMLRLVLPRAADADPASPAAGPR